MQSVRNRNELNQHFYDVQTFVTETYGFVAENVAGSVKVNDVWSVRDELAHILVWFRQLQSEIRFAVDNPGGTTPWKIKEDNPGDPYRTWNCEKLAELVGFSLSKLLQSFQEESAELFDFVKGLSDEETRRAVTVLDESVASSRREVRKRIDAALAERCLLSCPVPPFGTGCSALGSSCTPTAAVSSVGAKRT